MARHIFRKAMTLQIQPATHSELSVVLDLLTAAQLPTEGVREHFANFLIALADEQIIGCVGLEIYSDCALLRSLAVAPDWRGHGIGKQLTAQAISYAQANVVEKIVLLTTSTAAFFARHFGFVQAERRCFDDRLSNSPEWHLTTCASAVCMVLAGGSAARAEED
jgi:amino-acid N-acetyltransferase